MKTKPAQPFKGCWLTKAILKESNHFCIQQQHTGVYNVMAACSFVCNSNFTNSRFFWNCKIFKSTKENDFGLLPLPRMYEIHDHLFVCLLAGLHKYYWLDLHKKKCEDGSWSNLIPLNTRVIQITACIQKKCQRLGFSHLLIEPFKKNYTYIGGGPHSLSALVLNNIINN